MAMNDGKSREPTAAAVGTRTLMRRAAVKVVRGAALAAHSAAGVVMACDKEAERLVRAAEGILRAAAALLDVTDTRSPSSRPAEGAGAGTPRAAATRGGTARKTKKKLAHPDAAGTAMDLDAGAHGLSHDVGDDGLGDEWADDAKATTGEEHAGGHGAAGALSRGPQVQHSRERTPHRHSSANFAVGATVKLRGLVAKPAMNGMLATVTGFNPYKSRFGVRVQPTGDAIWVKPECIEPHRALFVFGTAEAGTAATSALPGGGQTHGLSGS